MEVVGALVVQVGKPQLLLTQQDVSVSMGQPDVEYTHSHSVDTYQYTFNVLSNCSLGLCDSNPCAHGTCSASDDGNSYTCSCPFRTGWEGKNCNECNPRFTGTYCNRCAPRRSGNSCESCFNGWSGSTCQIGIVVAYRNRQTHNEYNKCFF